MPEEPPQEAHFAINPGLSINFRNGEIFGSWQCGQRIICLTP